MVIKLIKGDKPPLSLIDALLFALMFGKASLKSHEGGSPVRRNKIPLLMDTGFQPDLSPQSTVPNRRLENEFHWESSQKIEKPLQLTTLADTNILLMDRILHQQG